MRSQLLKYVKIYAGIEHAEKQIFNLLQLTKKKQEFVITKNKQVNNFDTIIEEFKGQQHIFLIVNDEQVLSKKIENSNTLAKNSENFL